VSKRKKEKNTRRSKIKHASLEPRFNSRIRQEYIDIDYADQLDDTEANIELPNGEMVTEKEYMSRFMAEWNNASVGKQSKAEENSFHRTSEEVKDCTDRNNKRNNDLYGQMKAQGKMIKQDYYQVVALLDDMESLNHNETEDILIDILDKSEKFGESDDNTDD